MKSSNMKNVMLSFVNTTNRSSYALTRSVALIISNAH